jgi:chorismate dehydratase
MPGPIRVGAVSYLNARPLYYRLGEFAPGVRLEMDYPSRLAERLVAGALDVALIPSVEYLRGASSGYEILPGFAIAARGAVRSVKLFCRVPVDRIGRLALDDSSRTSQALARVWLDAAHGVRPARVEPLPMGVPVEESTADAVLLIGDRAMTVAHEPFHTVVDLAEAWKAMTGLPFVFALWVVRPEVDLGDLPEALGRCRAEGLAHADALAAEHGPRLGLSVETCYDYLTNVLSYDLGEPEVAGLGRFARMAARLGLAPEGVNLVFYRRRGLAARR